MYALKKILSLVITWFIVLSFLIVALVQFDQGNMFGGALLIVAAIGSFFYLRYYYSAKFDLSKECEKLFLGYRIRSVLFESSLLMSSWRQHEFGGVAIETVLGDHSDVVKVAAQQKAEKDQVTAGFEYRKYGDELLKTISDIQKELSDLAHGINKDDEWINLKSTPDQINFYSRNLIRQIADADIVREILVKKEASYKENIAKEKERSAKNIEHDSNFVLYNPTISLANYFAEDIANLENALSKLNPSPDKGTADFQRLVSIQKEYAIAVDKDKKAIADELLSEAKKLISKNKIEFGWDDSSE
jgi:hypothetical protein